MLRYPLVLLRRLGLDYSCFRIYSQSLTDGALAKSASAPVGYRVDAVGREALESNPYPEIRACLDYLGEDALLFGVYRPDGKLACVQCLWYGRRYRNTSFWHLDAKEAASVHLVCSEADRGKGLATWLKQETAELLQRRGFTRIYSRIWWTNRSSLRVSEKAGWKHVATVFELKVRGRAKPIRIVRHKHRMPTFEDALTPPVNTRRAG